MKVGRWKRHVSLAQVLGIVTSIGGAVMSPLLLHRVSATTGTVLIALGTIIQSVSKALLHTPSEP